jgi:hypothetical protein
MDKDLPLYDITLEDFEQGMYKISLVDKPAIEENFIYFDKTEVVEMFANDEKKEVVGPIMIPNKQILRHSLENGYYYVRFTEETIRDIMYNYSKKGLFNQFGIHHEYDTSEVVMLEVWMKESKNDKSTDYGYDLPNGTVFVKAKIESDELFSAIKEGEVNGFSIEIQADIKPVIKEEHMNEFNFAKELGKMEAQQEASAAKFEAKIVALEEENATLLEVLTSFEEKFAGVEDLKSAVEMIQKHISAMADTHEEEKEEEEKHEEEKEEKEEEMVEKKEKYIAPPTSATDLSEEKDEEKEYEAVEEEVTQSEVEEAFAAEQKAEEVEETVEDKTVVFNAITAEKVDMVNDFFNRFK